MYLKYFYSPFRIYWSADRDRVIFFPLHDRWSVDRTLYIFDWLPERLKGLPINSNGFNPFGIAQHIFSLPEHTRIFINFNFGLVSSGIFIFMFCHDDQLITIVVLEMIIEIEIEIVVKLIVLWYLYILKCFFQVKDFLLWSDFNLNDLEKKMLIVSPIDQIW